MINDVSVMPQYRRQGIGLALYLEASKTVGGWLLSDVENQTSPDALKVWKALPKYGKVIKGKLENGKPWYAFKVR